MPRPRKPVELLKIQGTYRPDRHGDRGDELTLPASRPEAPGWLDEVALTEWNRILSDERYARAITHADRAVLATYCALWGEIEAAGTEGTLASIKTSRLALFATICGRLGLDPPSRSKIRAVGSEKPKNEFVEFAEESRRFAN